MAKAANPTPDAQTSATCACGCGESVERTFKQGHDQVLVSKLAKDIVHGGIWDGRCLGILTVTDAKRLDLDAKIEKVGKYVGAKLSPALAAKFTNAADRQATLAAARQERAEAKAARKAEKPAPKPRKVKATAAVATSSEEAEDAPARTLALVKPTATNDDVDALEAAQAALGATVRVRIPAGRGFTTKEVTVTGMNQSGKVTAVEYAGRGGKTVSKTNAEGFEVVND